MENDDYTRIRINQSNEFMLSSPTLFVAIYYRVTHNIDGDYEMANHLCNPIEIDGKRYLCDAT